MATTAQPVPVTVTLPVPEQSPFDLPLASTPQSSGTLLRGLRSGLHAWHLLSFDAPVVAMLWTWFLARTNHVRLPAAAIGAMGLAVWMLYAADRLLDSRASESLFETGHQELEPRHHFHRKHQRGFRLGILAASSALALLLPQLATQSIRLYLVLGTLLVGYFALIHVNFAPIVARAGTRRLPKEIAVGIFFSAATFIPTVARAPELRLTLLPGAILFAVLCSLNCLFIYAWEHPLPSRQTRTQTRTQNRAQPHAATRISLRFLPHLALVEILTGTALILADHSLPWPLPAACVLATSLLLLLHRNCLRFSPTTLRAAADLCLLTPILLVPLLLH